MLRFDAWLPSLADLSRLLGTVWDELNEPDWVSNMRNEYRDKQGERPFGNGDLLVVGETAWAHQPGGWRTVSVSTQQVSYDDDEDEPL